MDQELAQYVAEKINLKNVTEAEKQQIVEGLMKNISTALSIAIVENLEGEDKETFLRLSQEGNSDALVRFASEKVPNMSELSNRVADRVIEEFKQLLQTH